MGRTLTLTASEIGIGTATPDSPEDGCITAVSQGSPLAEGETAVLFISETDLTITRIDVYDAAGDPVRSYYSAGNQDNSQNFGGLGDGISSPDALNTGEFAAFENAGDLQFYGTGAGFGDGVLLIKPGGIIDTGQTLLLKPNTETFDPDVFPSDIPCFVAGTLIDTEFGPRAIEQISVGDRVRTADNDLQTVVFAASRTVVATGHLAPVTFSKGALGNQRKLMVSPHHRMLVRGARIEMLFGQPEVLIAAEDLIDGDKIFRQPSALVTYVHIAFERHEIVFAEGARAESLQPLDADKALMSSKAYAELLQVLPELEQSKGAVFSARPTLSPAEVSVLQ